MTTRSLFTKNFILFSGVILLCFALFFVFSFLLRSVNTSKERMVPPHHQTFAALLKASEDPIATLKKYRERGEGHPRHLRMDLIATNGISLVDGAKGLDRALTPEEIATLAGGNPVSVGGSLIGPPVAFVTLFDADKSYLVAKFGGGPGAPRPGGPPGGPPPFLFFTSLLSFTLCILISVGIALLIFMSNYGRQAKAAMQVLDRMKQGDLKARMSSRKFDELAPLTDAYNQMANEVESLVESLKRSDQARRTMLQDLAHDLRTPLASLRVFLETLARSGAKMTEEKKAEVLQISLSEISYFSELVEDLLFLAQISEPKYSRETDSVDLKKVLEDQAVLFRHQYPQLKIETHLDDVGPDGASVPGSEQLLIRLIKNALANAASFAKSEVRLQLLRADGGLTVLVEDDGPGFSPGGLSEFGHKKASRKISKVGEASRISVGIGSVIMREIATLHGGDVRAENREGHGKIEGARVVIRLQVKVS